MRLFEEPTTFYINGCAGDKTILDCEHDVCRHFVCSTGARDQVVLRHFVV